MLPNPLCAAGKVSEASSSGLHPFDLIDRGGVKQHKTSFLKINIFFVTAMNFLVANKKANEHLLKYSVFMIRLDKLESLLLSQTVGLFDQSSEKNRKMKQRFCIFFFK